MCSNQLALFIHMSQTIDLSRSVLFIVTRNGFPGSNVKVFHMVAAATSTCMDIGKHLNCHD